MEGALATGTLLRPSSAPGYILILVFCGTKYVAKNHPQVQQSFEEILQAFNFVAKDQAQWDFYHAA